MGTDYYANVYYGVVFTEEEITEILRNADLLTPNMGEVVSMICPDCRKKVRSNDNKFCSNCGGQLVVKKINYYLLDIIYNLLRDNTLIYVTTITKEIIIGDDNDVYIYDYIIGAELAKASTFDGFDACLDIEISESRKAEVKTAIENEFKITNPDTKLLLITLVSC